MMKSVLLATSFLALGALVTGCASTAQGQKTSALMTSVPTESLQTEVPAGGVLAVIRYPAVVDTKAQDAFRRAYATRAIGGKAGSGTINSAEAGAIADGAVVKSNYFALSLYKELAARLPEHAVLLSPHAVTLDAGGSLTSEPITQAESLASVVAIDFATYSHPDTDKMMGKAPQTFGDLITPLVTVRTDHRAAAPTQGVLLASRPLLTRAAAEGRENALETIAALQGGDLAPVTPELDFVSYITNDTPASVSTSGLGKGVADNAAMSLPVEKIRFSKTDMQALKTATDGSVDPLDDVYTEPLAARIVAILNDLDTDRAVMMGKAASVAEFDPSLAALTFVGSDDADYAARVNYAERLLEAQRKYLSVQSLRIFDGVHNSEMGAQVRDLIVSEYNVLERRRELARKQNMATALAVVGAVAGGVAMGSGSNCGNARTQSEYNNCVRNNQAKAALGQIGIQSAIYAATEAAALNRMSKNVGSNYLTSIVPALEQQTTVTVDLLDSNETITAIRYEDLQAKLQSLYASKQRSLDTVATRCAYLDGAGARTGTWLGVCEGGLANGSGAGAYSDGDATVEYYGYTRNGLADGPGLMIRHAPDASTSYEGQFRAGQPDGAVRVSQSGQADRTRQFSAGQDVGASSQAAPSPFDGPSPLGTN